MAPLHLLRQLTRCLLASPLFIALALTAAPPSLSPDQWPTEERTRLETLESRSWSPEASRNLASEHGLIAATVSPLAVHAGIEALRLGGTAADAAVVTALTQVTTQLGSVVSYAGVLTGLYYDARTGQVQALDAGFNSYLGETDPATIPASTFGGMISAAAAGDVGSPGRKTLVPGFMAGVDALHHRFGRLPFRDLFQPAIWYARNGVTVSPVLASFFALRAPVFARTPEGRRFLAQAGSALPQAGERFVQSDLAATLAEVAAHGAAAFHQGNWARAFVEQVRRDGGRATADDLERYQPTWSDPQRVRFLDHEILMLGAPHTGSYALIPGLNLIEALALERQAPYWENPAAFLALDRIGKLLAAASPDPRSIEASLRHHGFNVPLHPSLTKDFARELAPELSRLAPLPASDQPRHSNSIVVVDREGNIAALTHTINTMIWGESGIVVGGIPLPDSAGFQQARLQGTKPGDRLPHEILDTIVLREGRPVLATASIGSSLLPETLRVLLGILGHRHDLGATLAAPPLLLTFDPAAASRTTVPEAVYPARLIESLRAQGATLTEVPAATASALRGTVAAVQIEGSLRRACEVPGIMVFAGSEP
ncbi:MAG: gamma-glutamyltransferase [Opitutaceae bacterium]|nr:gamma-glutamyltransferase [Opitutaceae bacterium]